MQHFSHDGFDLAYLDEGAGEPVLLIHGFASNMRVNWVSPGWVKTLTEAGYRAIALDNRGHGASSKSHRPADYYPDKMAADAAALLDHLGLERAHVMGYSMGARVAAFMALAFPEKVATLVFGGLGIAQPTLVAVGTTDDIAGSPEALAALMTNASAFAIEGRDHMLSVGDRTFKKRALAFFQENPL
jgi:pimeloyl-ACP methyl ester carboxylesterase